MKIAARPDDMLEDLFPRTGAVAEAWRTWRLKCAPPDDPVAASPRPGSAPSASRRQAGAP